METELDLDDVTREEVESFYTIADQVDVEDRLASTILGVVRESGLVWESGLACKIAKALIHGGWRDR